MISTPIRSSQQLGKLIAAARRRKKMSQRNIASELGVTQAWISRVERGQQKAWIGQVLRLATCLGVELTGSIQGTKVSKHTIFPDINDVFKR